MKPFHLEIVTPDGLAFSGEVESLLVRTTDGDVEILAGHAELLASLATGRARLIADGKSRFASVSGGFVSVQDSVVRLVAITFEFAEDIDSARAKAAKERAEAALKAASDERAELVAKAKLARAVSRINISELL